MKKSKVDDLQIFLEISVYLTGFNKNELLGTGMLETYYNTVAANSNPEILDFFYVEARRILSCGNEDEINKEIKLNLIPDSAYRGLAKNIITMWYMGNWGGQVINAESYIQGLVWDAAETHPPGAKQPGYGSWSERPIHINCKKHSS